MILKHPLLSFAGMPLVCSYITLETLPYLSMSTNEGLQISVHCVYVQQLDDYLPILSSMFNLGYSYSLK